MDVSSNVRRSSRLPSRPSIAFSRTRKYESSGSLGFGIHPSYAYRVERSGFKVPRYQNTYHLSSKNPYQCEKVDNILKQVMDNCLKDVVYNPETCKKLCSDIGVEVQSRIERHDFDRYKFIVTIMIVERLDQGVCASMGHLWDADRDSYSMYVFQNSSLHATGTVHGVYYE